MLWIHFHEQWISTDIISVTIIFKIIDIEAHFQMFATLWCRKKLNNYRNGTFNVNFVYD